MGYAWPESDRRDERGMSESNKVGAASLAEFVRATQDAELDDGDAERITTLLADTKRSIAPAALITSPT